MKILQILNQNNKTIDQNQAINQQTILENKSLHERISSLESAQIKLKSFFTEIDSSLLSIQQSLPTKILSLLSSSIPNPSTKTSLKSLK